MAVTNNLARSPQLFFLLETRRLTIAFWATVALFTAAFFVTPYLPLIDYQQHVALAAILRHLADSSAPEHALYEANLITYNGGFHVLVAGLSFVFPAEQAGRLVMATYPVLFAAAALAVVRVAQRPAWYAFLSLPIIYSRAMAWGFANWNLTFPVAVLAFTWWLRFAQGERRLFPRLLLASIFCAYGHVLAMGTLCFAIGVAQLSRFRHLGPTPARRLLRLAATPLPVLPGILWCAFVFRYQTSAAFSNWAEASLDGLDDPLWYKLRHILTMSVGNFTDLSDNILLLLSLLFGGILLVAGSPVPVLPNGHGPGDVDADHAAQNLRAIRWVAIAFFGCYLVIPKVFVATWFVYERFPPLALLFFAGALPCRLIPYGPELRSAVATVAVAAGANTLRGWATMGEASDASAIIDDMPPGRKLFAVTYDVESERIARGVFVHLAALYQTRKRGEIDYTFTKFESMVVHYKPGQAPPAPPPHLALEWNGARYNPNASWARAYDLTLVHAPAGVDDPQNLVFQDVASKVHFLARRGRFWLYDTSQLALANETLPAENEP